MRYRIMDVRQDGDDSGTLVVRVVATEPGETSVGIAVRVRWTDRTDEEMANEVGILVRSAFARERVGKTIAFLRALLERGDDEAVTKPARRPRRTRDAGVADEPEAETS